MYCTDRVYSDVCADLAATIAAGPDGLTILNDTNGGWICTQSTYDVFLRRLIIASAAKPVMMPAIIDCHGNPGIAGI